MINQKKIEAFEATELKELKGHDFIFETQYDYNDRIHREDLDFNDMKAKLILLAKLAKPPRVRIFDKVTGKQI